MTVLVQQMAGQVGTVRLRLRSIAFAALALFILLAPAAYQVFGASSVLLRPWIMYSGVGTGILKGEFRIAVPGKPVRVRTPLQILGLERYPYQLHYVFDRRVFSAGDLRHFAAEVCAGLPAGATLSFRGQVGTRDGWAPLEAADICAGGDKVAR